MDFSPYKAIILPDDIRIDDELKAKLDAYLAKGGKLVLSGESGLWKGREAFALDLGVEYQGLSPSYAPENEPNQIGRAHV
jgi:beta-galactosidase GanA